MLGNTTANSINIRIKHIYTNKLSSILKVRGKPIICNSSYAIIIQFLNKNLMINSVRTFLKINKNTARKVYFVYLFFNFISGVNKSMRVECFCLNPNCRLYIRLLVSRNTLYIIFSKTLSMFDNRDIGR